MTEKKIKILTDPINFIVLVYGNGRIHVLPRGFRIKYKKKKKNGKFVLYFIMLFHCHRFITVFVVPPVVKLNEK